MSYIPLQGMTFSVMCDNSDVISLLNSSIEENKKCCNEMTKYMISVNSQLNQQGLILRELLKCCRYNRPKEYNGVAGQGYDSLYLPTKVRVRVYNEPPIEYVKPKCDIRRNFKMFKYSASRGYFTVMGIPTEWSVVGRRILDRNGVDLSMNLPIYFNEKICEGRSYRNSSSNNVDWRDCKELVGIMGYVVKDTALGRTALLIYETKDLYTGVVKTFEGGVTLWDRYAINSRV